VIWGGRVFLTSSEDGGAERIVLGLNADTGDIEWTRRYESRSLEKNRLNSYASATPAVDREHLYVVFATPDSYMVRALDHSGEDVWKHDLGSFQAQHGAGASPILLRDLLVMPNEQDGRSFVVALERSTGEIRWKTERRSSKAAYGTPCVYREADGREAILLSSQAHGLSSLDAVTGKPNWEATVFDKRTVSSPLCGKGLAIGTCGSGGGGNYLVAVRTGGEGDVTSSHAAYKLVQSIPYVPCPIVLGDLLFLWNEKGIVTCVELQTGETVWRERVGGRYFGSPVCIRKRLFCMSEEGEVVVLAAAPEFEVLARNALGEGSRSTPAVAGGWMYLRTYTHLLRVGGPPKASAAEETGKAD
jgi:outer membrane protein assembly factor BamB